MSEEGDRIPTVAEILELVSHETGVSLADLLGPRRTRALARPRQLAMWLACETCSNKSLPQIGHVFGGRHHTTIMHGRRVINKERLTKPHTLALSDRLLSILRDDPRQMRLIA